MFKEGDYNEMTLLCYSWSALWIYFINVSSNPLDTFTYPVDQGLWSFVNFWVIFMSVWEEKKDR